MTKYRIRQRARSWAVQARDDNPIAVLAAAAAMGNTDIAKKIKWRTLSTTRFRRLATLILWALRSFGG